MMNTVALALAAALLLPPPGGVRVEVSRGHARLVTGGHIQTLLPRRGAAMPAETAGPAARAHLEIGSSSEALIRWPGDASLRLYGSTSVEWGGGEEGSDGPTAHAEGALILRFHDLSTLDLEIRHPIFRLALPQGWTALLPEGAYHLSSQGSGPARFEHLAGAPVVWEGPGRGRITVRAGEIVRLTGGSPRVDPGARMRARPDRRHAAWEGLAWPWGQVLEALEPRSEPLPGPEHLQEPESTPQAEPLAQVAAQPEPASPPEPGPESWALTVADSNAGTTAEPAAEVASESSDQTEAGPAASPVASGPSDVDRTWIPVWGTPADEPTSAPQVQRQPEPPIEPGAEFAAEPGPAFQEIHASVAEPDAGGGSGVAAAPAPPAGVEASGEAEVPADPEPATGPTQVDEHEPVAAPVTAPRPEPVVETEPGPESEAEDPFAGRLEGLDLVDWGVIRTDRAEGLEVRALGGGRWKFLLDRRAPDEARVYGVREDFLLARGSVLVLDSEGLYDFSFGLLTREPVRE